MSTSAEEVAALRADVRQLSERIKRIEAQASPTMDSTAAMHRLGYSSVNGFWQAVRRLGIPFSRLSARRFMFRTSDIDAAMQRRQVGTRARRLAA